MKTTRDGEEEQRFYDGLAAYMQQTERVRQDKIYHVSDLLTPRQAYFKRVDPLPLTRAQLGYFLAGQAHHLIAEIILKRTDGKGEEKITLEISDHQIIGTQDVFRDLPIEFKTSRKWTIDPEPAQHYTDQLLMYCAMNGVLEGKIVVFYLAPGRKADGSTSTVPELACWHVQFEQEEVDRAKLYLGCAAVDLTSALLSSDHSLLPLCEEWMCGSRNRKGEVKINCGWYEKCQPQGRYPSSRLSGGGFPVKAKKTKVMPANQKVLNEVLTDLED